MNKTGEELSNYQKEALNQLKDLNTNLKTVIELLIKIENKLIDLEKIQLMNQ